MNDGQIVWTANRGMPVQENYSLTLSQDKGLQLVDADGSVVWSAGTFNELVAGMKIKETGNLVVFGTNNNTLWQSFDQPTDSLVPYQSLREGQTLTSNSSASNLSEGSYYLTMTNGNISLFIKSYPPQMYGLLNNVEKRPLSACGNNLRGFKKTTYTIPNKGFNCTTSTGIIYQITYFSGGSSNSIKVRSLSNFFKLESDGRFKLYQWSIEQSQWTSSEIELNRDSDECLYPSHCGEFGVCKDGQCSCPKALEGESQYFKNSNDELPNLGCKLIIPLPPCDDTNYVSMVEFGHYSYFNYVDLNASASDFISLNECKEACLNNCSCKAIFFKSDSYGSRGKCYMLDQVFSIRADPLPKQIYLSQSLIKVANLTNHPVTPKPEVSLPPVEEEEKKKGGAGTTPIVIGCSIVALFIAGTVVVFLVIKKREKEDDEELDQVNGMMPRRFSYKELQTATENFEKVLGKGGFGSVFIGVLNDGTQIAVKRLESARQGMKEFKAEVQTIGNINHLNLVKLIGFCMKKTHTLLVYEYMCNGSLNKWIFQENDTPLLDWKTRQQIILGTAKGLCYLHEECRQRIVHLDIKPENILLDENFNAKLSDFGLSKLINRNESHVVTTVRGTPGYLAPEWQSAAISEKADVYSFGIVLIEVVCGRRNLDPSLPEQSKYLLRLLQSVEEENQLLDLVNMESTEKSAFREEALRMMKIATRCLETDYTKRPSMSTVVKVLEGTLELESCIGSEHLEPWGSEPQSEVQSGSTRSAVLLSGPR